MNGYTRRLYRIVAIDTALALLIAVSLIASNISSSDRSMRYVLLDKPESVSSIRIDGIATVELKRTQDGWSMAKDGAYLPADGVRVESFLKAVASVTHLEPVARDKSSWSKLGLEGDSARTLTLSDDKGMVLSEFTIGDYSQSPGLLYMAPAGSNAAYAVASGMASYALGKPASWLNLTVWSNAPSVDAVQELVCSGNLPGEDGSIRNLSYTLTRAGSGWSSNGVALDPAKVEAALRSLIALRGEDYASSDDSQGQAFLKMEMRLGNGRTLSLSLEGRRDDGRYPVLSSQRERRLYLQAWAVQESFKTLEELLPQSGS